jgi:integrase/recombinase XerC
MTDKFLTYLRAEKRYSGHTIEAYERDIAQFTQFLAAQAGEGFAFDPAAVTTDDVREWILDLSGRKLSAASINRKTSSLRSFFRYLRKTGVMEGDPFRGVGMRKAPSRLPAFVPESKMDDILARLDEGLASDDPAARRDAMLVTLFYTTGLRVSELQAVKVGDFSQGFSELKVMGKGGKERVVPVIWHTRRKIVEYLDGFRSRDICISPDLSLFLTDGADPLSRSAIYRIVREQLSLAGVQGKKSPHVLRHTFATHMMDGGADIREIQEILGHSSLAATQIYTHNSISRLKEAYEKAHPRSRGTAPEKDMRPRGNTGDKRG